MGTNLRQKQTAMLVRMLNFNTPLADDGDRADGSGWSETWKVLVYDRKCRDIISPLLNVSKLRKRGVTLHLLLESDREDIPDVPAVYFMEPTADNIQRVATDCTKRLYSAFHLNFVSKLDRTLMERLARATIATNSHTLITRVYDQYLDFVTLEPKLFSLNLQHSYVEYNNPGASEEEIQTYARSVTYGLFSVLATMGSVPVIRCAPGGPAEMVAQQLNSLVSDHLMQGSSTFFSSSAASGAASASSFHRPLLILIDRNEDLITSLHHTSTYQALVDDVLQHKLNRVNIETTSPDEGTKRKTYDLDIENDAFYARYAGSLFPEAIDANSNELNEVSKKEEEIRSKTMSQFGGGGNDDGMQDGAKGLLSAVDSLPQLLERKKSLEVHTNILRAIFNTIAAREVPVLFEMEESMVLTSRGDKAAIKPILADPTKATLQDKLRLLAVYTLATKASSGDLTELQEVLRQSYANAPTPPPPNWPSQQEVEAGIGAVDYLRRQRSVQHLPDRSEVEGAKAQQAGAAGGYVSTFITKAQSQATGLLAKATNLLSRRNTLYVTRVVENLCTSKPNSEDDTYLYLDPKVKGVDPSSLKGRAPPREVIVFMIGGGCYAEYQNLLEYGRQQQSTAPRSIIYGCTEVMNAEAFISQLVELGRKPT